MIINSAKLFERIELSASRLGIKNVNKPLLLLLHNTLKIPLAERGTLVGLAVWELV